MRRAVIASPSDVGVAPVAPGGFAILRSPAQFARCLDRRPLVRDGAFALHVAFGDGSAGGADAGARASAGGWRLGLVIPKRHEPSAVARNTIKRRWRAAFARIHAACAREFGAADIVVRLSGPLVPKSAPAAVKADLAPAKRRARSRFDPQALLVSLVDRLRRVAADRGTRAEGRGDAAAVLA